MSKPDELVSLSELARRVGKDVDTVRRWRDRDGLPVYRLTDHSHVVVWGEYQEWLSKRAVHNRSLSVMQSA